tara:strand:- start:13094 stop:14269 length:1176 start_codon:yes stop_codon:yes gene_type:complete
MQEILNKITPTKQEENEVKTKLKEFLKKLKIQAKPQLGGSYAKGTWLRGNHDIDIFIKFKENKDLSNRLEKALKPFKYKRIHGSRDYFQLDYKGLDIELIPVLDITKPEQAKNVTDVSPLHLKYIKKHTTKTIQNEIRLAKQFFKANQLYGAETHIGGFSGHAVELLIIHYKSLKRLLNSAKNWEEKTVIDPAKQYKNKKQLLLSLNSSKKQSPLILIDPAQKDRNASAALSKKKYQELIKIATTGELNFEKKEFKLKDLKGYIILEVTPLTGKTDVVGAKIVKVYNKITKDLNNQGFLVKDSGWHWEKKAYLYFKTKSKIPKLKEHKGPIKTKKEHSRVFKSKYKKTYTKKGRLYTKTEIKHTEAKPFIKELIKEEYIKSRVKTIKYLNR